MFTPLPHSPRSILPTGTQSSAMSIPGGWWSPRSDWFFFLICPCCSSLSTVLAASRCFSNYYAESAGFVALGAWQHWVGAASRGGTLTHMLGGPKFSGPGISGFSYSGKPAALTNIHMHVSTHTHTHATLVPKTYRGKRDAQAQPHPLMAT